VKELRGDATFVAIHAGNIGGAGAWETLVAAERQLRGKAAVLFVGDGSAAGAIRGWGARVVPFRPVHQIPSVMAAGDLQIVSVRRGMEGAVVPSKLYTALAYGRPILAVASEQSDVTAIVQRWGCGLVADPDSPEAVAARIRWAQEHPGALREMAARAASAGRYFERGRQLDRLVSFIHLAAGQSPVRPANAAGSNVLGGPMWQKAAGEPDRALVEGLDLVSQTRS
jgi:glycosyltransferase involved in cell wall biosynthesis